MLGWLRNKWQRDLVTLRERREEAAQKHRDRKILCPRCGYDIQGMPDRRCSECGLFVKSRWRNGRFAAGSAWRYGMLWGAAGGSLYILIFGMGGWLLIYTPAIRVLLPYEPLLYLAIAAFAAHWFVVAGILMFVILRQRWLIYGPRSYAVRTAALCLALVVGTGIIADRVWQWVAATIAA